MLHTDLVRRLLVMFHIQGYNVADIEKQTRLPRATIASIVHLRTKRAKIVMETGLHHKGTGHHLSEAEKRALRARAEAQPSIRDAPNTRLPDT